VSDILKFGKGGGKGNRSVFGYPERWVWAKDSVGILAAYKKKQDFFHVLWQINTSGQVDFRVESPSHDRDAWLNRIKCQVIAALLAKMDEKGYDYKVGNRISPDQLRKNRSSKAFRIILTDNQLKTTHEENIQKVHDMLGETVDEVLEPFHEQLSKYFRRLRRDQIR
jgi:hypothetical protein